MPPSLQQRTCTFPGWLDPANRRRRTEGQRTASGINLEQAGVSAPPWVESATGPEAAGGTREVQVGHTIALKAHAYEEALRPGQDEAREISSLTEMAPQVDVGVTGGVIGVESVGNRELTEALYLRGIHGNCAVIEDTGAFGAAIAVDEAKRRSRKQKGAAEAYDVVRWRTDKFSHDSINHETAVVKISREKPEALTLRINALCVRWRLPSVEHFLGCSNKGTDGQGKHGFGATLPYRRRLETE